MRPKFPEFSGKAAHFYDAFAPFYPLVEAFFRPQKRALKFLLNALPAGTLIDLGTGDGSSFSAFGKHTVTGVDISPKMLQRARKKAPPGTTLLRADLHGLPFGENTFDYVVLSHVISTVAQPEKVFSEAARVLKPGGKLFILNHFTPDNTLGLLDKMFQPFSSKLRFRSVFYERDLPLPETFRKISARYWLGRYFGLLVYKKEERG